MKKFSNPRSSCGSREYSGKVGDPYTEIGGEAMLLLFMRLFSPYCSTMILVVHPVGAAF
jgi:hypothetical protein